MIECNIDQNVIESIQNMDASDDEKIGRLDAYVHEILYNRRLFDARFLMIKTFEIVKG